MVLGYPLLFRYLYIYMFIYKDASSRIKGCKVSRWNHFCDGFMELGNESSFFIGGRIEVRAGQKELGNKKTARKCPYLKPKLMDYLGHENARALSC